MLKSIAGVGSGWRVTRCGGPLDPECRSLRAGYWLLGIGYLYHFSVEPAERLLKSIRKQGFISPGDRVSAAVSGGADSVALMLMLLELRNELGIVLSVAHVNHKLRGEESDADQRFVEDLCRSHDLDLSIRSAAVNPISKSGIEAAARELRYTFFRELAGANPGLKIATAHTLDDQAETVLLRILRGTGIRGLAGIHPRITFEEQGRVVGEVIRPLLSFRRQELERFLRERGQTWREDSSNRDATFLRNRVRHTVLPSLEENFGPAVVENLSDLAEIARAENAHWQSGHPEVQPRPGDLNVSSLRAMPLATQRRLVRAWIEACAPEADVSFRMVEEVRELADSAPGKALEIAGGNGIRRTRDSLSFDVSRSECNAGDYEYSLSIPGQVAIPELNLCLGATITDLTDVPEHERLYLLDPDRLPPALTVRNWRPGDRYWPAHTKEPQKVKDLLNDRHVLGPEKKRWPVLVAGDELVWVRGFPAPSAFQPQANATSVVLIRECER